MIRNIKIAKALSKQGLTSEFTPIQTKQGDDYVDGEHIFLLTRKIGEPLNLRPLTDEEIGRLENNELRDKYGYQLGQAIAKLHKALKSVQDDVKAYEGNLHEQGKNAIPIVKKLNMGISDDFFNDYIENFGKLNDKLPKQLIHGNLCGDTAVYENGDVVAFKGFETYNLSFPRVYDIIWGAGEVNSQPLIDDYLNTLTEMLKGYDSINPLTAEEKQSIYYVLCAMYLKGYGYYAETDETFDLMARGNRAMVFLSKNKEMFSNLI
jgi:Ser/Thr protein kinase RdoA (MazF antagonist)